MCAEVVEETDYGSDELRDGTVEQTDLRIQSVSNRDLWNYFFYLFLKVFQEIGKGTKRNQIFKSESPIIKVD